MNASPARPRMGCFSITATAALGLFTMSSAMSAGSTFIKKQVRKHQLKSAPTCGTCLGRCTVPCEICKERKAITWRERHTPDFEHTIVCPACMGKAERVCPHCIGEGVVIS